MNLRRTGSAAVPRLPSSPATPAAATAPPMPFNTARRVNLCAIANPLGLNWRRYAAQATGRAASGRSGQSAFWGAAGISLCRLRDWRPVVCPRRRGLPRSGRAEHQRVRETRPHDLKPDRQAGLGAAAGHAGRRVADHVQWKGERDPPEPADRLPADLAVPVDADRQRGSRERGREQQVEAREIALPNVIECAAAGRGPHKLHRAPSQAPLDPRQGGWIELIALSRKQVAPAGRGRRARQGFKGVRGIAEARGGLVDAAPQLLEARRGGSCDPPDFGIDGGVSPVRGPSHPQASHRPAAGRGVLGAVGGERAWIPRIGTADRIEQEGRIPDRPRHRAGVQHDLQSAEQRRLRHAPERGLEADDPAATRGDADGSAAVGAHGERPQPGGDGRGMIFDIKEKDIYWCTADIGWVTGHSYIIYGPLTNGTTVLMYEGSPDFPDRGRFWSIVERYRVNILYTAPTAIRAFMRWGTEWPAKYDLSSLRVIGTVGEPINPEAWIWYHENIGRERCPIVDTWWQTETGMIMISPLPGITATKPGSATHPFPGVEAEVLDEKGQPVGPGAGGYLVLTKPWPAMFRTIYGDPDRYVRQYWSRYPGKYFTGDGAKIDEDGYFWLLGRVDDVMNVAGHRISTYEVESALVDHPAVAEAAVIGRTHELKGQGIAGFVTLKEGIVPSESLKDELKQHVVKKIGPIARPDDIFFTAELPKTRSAKIMRRLLRDVAEGRVLGDTTTLADPTVIAHLKRQYEQEG